ncbi:MAG TPA: hypothetical protein VKS01_09420, partial [Bryobacteraceae bacterium]|nr:hypothetical protein [Bryobacteraceae bacterium]
MPWIRQLREMLALVALLLIASCATLRTQTIHSAKGAWLSTSGDEASLNQLALVSKSKSPAPASFIQLENGTQVYITHYANKRCQGSNVF